MKNNNLIKQSYEGSNLVLTDTPTLESFQKVQDNLMRAIDFQEDYIRSQRK